MPVTRRSAIRTFTGAALGAAFMPPDQGLQPGLCLSKPVPGFEPFCFTDDAGGRHQVYVAGSSGPPVILLHELPGLVDDDLEAATRIAAGGYRVLAPLMFGDPGGEGETFGNLRRVCGKDQFACRHGEMTSPHVTWLRGLCRAAKAKWPEGQGVGVIGMCLTGAFPIALLSEEAVVAPVLCQPTIPFNIFTRFRLFTDLRALGISDADLEFAKTKRDVPLLGIRYTRDWRSRAPRFERLVDDFGSRFYRLDLDGKHHSTLGKGKCDDAFLEVASFFNQHLRTTPDPSVEHFPRRSKPNSKEEVRITGCEGPRDHETHK